VGRAQGLSELEVERMTIVVSELAHNQLAHARGGAVAVRPLSRGGVPGLEVVAADKGPGLAHPTAALRGRQESTRSLGAGLAGVLRQADEVDVDVRWGEGTCVRARKYLTPPPHRGEVGILSRPYPGETLCGDQALWLWREETLVVGVADGLGHGPSARLASDRAMEMLRSEPHLPLEALLSRGDTWLSTTRGAALGMVRMERDTRRLVQACVGNVATLLCTTGHSQSLPCLPGVLGLSRRMPSKRRTYQAHLEEGGLLVMHTDGLSSRTSVEDPLLMRRHPLEVAHALLQRFGKDHDDALVLVARLG
jgi:anti-sigma regulatory factor (Ser/Thr protein kinase)